MSIHELSLFDLYATESESQCRVLSDGLVRLEAKGASPELLEELMRAAHSLKGAARIVNFNQAVRIAHAIEDLFVSAQKGEKTFNQSDIDRLLSTVDLLAQIGTDEKEEDTEFEQKTTQCLDRLRQASAESTTPDIPLPLDSSIPEPPSHSEQDSEPNASRMLKVSAENLNLMLGSTAESLVTSRRLLGYIDQFWNIQRHQHQTKKILENALSKCPPNSAMDIQLRNLMDLNKESDQLLQDGILELDRFERSSTQLAQRLYAQALSCRMRPFAEITGGLRRAARDAARHVGYKVAVEIIGEGTDVDRDLLEKLESPLGHLIRNAIEHGIEPVEERLAVGKPPEGTLRIEASHTAGFLVIRISDNGRGISIENLKEKIVERGLSSLETVSTMNRIELLDFLFLPGFSTKSTVSELSGRGVGLDVVHALANAARGTARIQTEEGQGTVFSLQFPVSLSVMRVLLFELDGEPYAMPLARAEHTEICPTHIVESVEGRQFFVHKGERIGLVDGAEVLNKKPSTPTHDELYVLILGPEKNRYGVIVSRFLGEGEVVIQPLDPNLGKVRNIAAAALSENGDPILLIDPDDYLISLERFVKTGKRTSIIHVGGPQAAERRKILVVEDSLTVRELERKLIISHGFDVDTAVDGVDGWNAVRSGGYSVVVTDIDMPRMDGFELTTLIKNDPRLRDTPVIIVSYKDREEDRLRGLDAGADYYLTKSSFQDEGLIRAISDVLGEPGIE